MLPATGSTMPSTRGSHHECRALWNGYSIQASHILRHGFGYTTWTRIGSRNPSTILHNTRLPLKQLRCTTQCYADLVSWPTTSSLLMRRTSVPNVVIAGLLYLQQRSWDTLTLHVFYLIMGPTCI